MAMLPKLKLKALVNFPANVIGGTGIGITKANGNFTVDLDYSEFAFLGSLPTGSNVLVWDPVSNVYTLVPPSATGGISDAPTDGLTYGRRSGAWVDAWASPALTGSPTAPTPSPGDSDTSIATTAFVTAAVVASTVGVASIGTRTGTITLNGGSMATNELPAPRYDVAQTLTDDVGVTAGQKTQARQNVYAAPFDALAYNGMQVNGSMEVSQEKGATISVTSYAVDGWAVGTGSLIIVPSGQVADAPPGFIKSIKMTVTTPGTPASSEGINFTQKIEGYRISRLGFGTASAQSITIGFWTKIHRPGLYSGAVINNLAARACPFAFTQNAADTWEYKTVTVPGDVTGVPATDNASGLQIIFSAAVASNRQGTAGVWTSATPLPLGVTGTTNGVAATSDTFQLTGVVVLPGIEAPSAARSPLIMRPYDQELPTCQRHYEIGTMIVGTSGPSAASTNQMAWKVTKRAAPTILTSFDTGTGGVIAPLLGNVYSIYQSVAHSSIASATVKGDARL